jgi:hypothetical protein
LSTARLHGTVGAMFRLLSFSVLALLATSTAGVAETQTRNVLFISLDGMRWQEVFRGADAAIMNKEYGGVPEAAKLYDTFWAETPEVRREKLMPFFWRTIAREGQLYGNRDAGSLGDVTNTRWISYPGYSEFLTGHADPGITTNKPIPNPNVTVLEWLNSRPGFAGKVFAVNAWQVLPQILNAERSKIPMWTPGLPTAPGVVSQRILEMEKLIADIPQPWVDEHYDAFVYQAAVDVLEHHHPRVLYVNFGETDEWAHARRYDYYLETARREDRWIRELWEKMQAIDQYRGCTTLIVTTDHGRGVDPEDWTSHNDKIPNCSQWWTAILGPDTPPLGERKNCAAVTQSQIAATIAAVLGEDFRAAPPKPPLRSPKPSASNTTDTVHLLES